MLAYRDDLNRVGDAGVTCNEMTRRKFAGGPTFRERVPLTRQPRSMTKTVSSPQLKVVAWMLLLVAAAITTGTAATVYVSGDAARRIDVAAIYRMRSLHPNSRDAAVDRAHRQTTAARLLIDSVLAPLGPTVELDSISLRRVVAVTTHVTTRDANAWIAVGDAPQVGDSVDLALFRRWARAKRLPNFWGYRIGFAGARTSYDLPTRSMLVLKRFVIANEASADSALQVHDIATAMIRARENIGAARQLVDQPIMIDMLVGRALLQRGARLMQRVAEVAHDSVARDMAIALDTIAHTTFLLRQTEHQQLIAYGLDANDERLHAIAADRALHPALRLGALDGEVRGACLRSDEILTGPSAERRATLERLLAAVADIPRASELAPLYRQSLDQLDVPPTGAEVEPPLHGADRFVSNFRWIIPATVRNRVRWCRMIG